MIEEIKNILNKINAINVQEEITEWDTKIYFEFNEIIFSINYDIPDNTDIVHTKFCIENIKNYSLNKEVFIDYSFSDNLEVIIDFIEELNVPEVFEPYQDLKNFIFDINELYSKYENLLIVDEGNVIKNVILKIINNK